MIARSKKDTEELFADLMDNVTDTLGRAELKNAPADPAQVPADPAQVPADPAQVPADPAQVALGPAPEPVAQPAREGKADNQPNPFAWNLANHFPRQRPYFEDRRHDLAVVQMSSTVLEELEKNEWNMRLYHHLSNKDERFWEGDLYRWVRVDRTVRQPKNQKYFLVCFGDDEECVIFPSMATISRVLGARTTSIKWILPIN
eukprot:g63824.t1